MSTHNLRFGAKIRKTGPLHTPFFFLYKCGVQVGMYTLHGHVILMHFSCELVAYCRELTIYMYIYMYLQLSYTSHNL